MQELTPDEELAQIELVGGGPFYIPASLGDAVMARYGRMPSNVQVHRALQPPARVPQLVATGKQRGAQWKRERSPFKGCRA